MGAGSSRKINIYIAIPAFITYTLDYWGTVCSGRMRRRDYLYTTILEFLKELWCQLNLWREEGLEQVVIPGGTAELTHKGLVGEEEKRETKAGRERLGQWNGPRPQDRWSPAAGCSIKWPPGKLWRTLRTRLRQFLPRWHWQTEADRARHHIIRNILLEMWPCGWWSWGPTSYKDE